MPPATKPILLQLLENLETTLALIDGGADYFFDLNVIKVGEDIEQTGVFPAATLGIGEIGKLLENVGGRVLWSGSWTWEIDVVCQIEEIEKPHVALIRLMHDVHHAMMVDPRRGGIAVNTTVTGGAFYPPAGPQEPRSTLVVGLEIQFRTKDTSMLVGT